ncbi:hypothetical protein [Curtobacterium sp. MCBD17_008]|uniref:hypothetical protein n=1 Tax=Curtobacterium sp. MCBD17_008 TaxID=2175656 RepID=UPI000DA9FEF4|nr:hypothetical protein [Curtobacterium sp. MCBD17_008]PZE92509.1 hypothetical protein DEI95_08270 [Curtobacterium sp. MCBD17_008]
MVLDKEIVSAGMIGALRLEELLTGDLQPIIWRHDRDDPDAADLRDYVVGVSGSIRTNLIAAAAHLESYTQLRYKQDNAIKIGLSRDGRIPAGEAFSDQGQRMMAAEQGFFTALGAALDCSAAVCVAVSGLRYPVLKADMPFLLPTSDELDFPAEGRRRALKDAMRGASPSLKELQHQVLGGIHGAHLASGPPGWLRWMLDVRNTAVHRERPMNFHYVDVDRKAGTRVYRYMRRHPRLSNLQAIRLAGSDIDDLLLEEDAADTLASCGRSTSALIHGVAAVVDKAWNERRITLDVRVAAADQWGASETSSFPGFAPGSAPRFAQGTELHLNPADSARLQAGRVLDHDRLR